MATTRLARRTGAVDQPGDRHDNRDDEVAAALAQADGGARRRWPLLLLGGVIGAVATGAVMSFVSRQDGTADIEAEVVELATAVVEQRDLVEEIEWSGTLGYGQAVTIGGTGGVVTTAPAGGTVVERGDVLASVDDRVAIVFYGDVPMWRDLAEGVEGDDVFQLEANLAALGYDPDQSVDIDRDFTANTAHMVERWQEDLGVEVTGEVAYGDIVVVEGPSSVVSIAPVGSASAGELATIVPQRAVRDVVTSIDGTIGGIAPVGQEVEHGTTLFTVDEIPVVAITEVDEVTSAMLDPTFTDLELEEALVAAGYDGATADDDAGSDDVVADGVITEATQNAIIRWQEAAGLPVTGLSDPGYYEPVPVGRVVEAHLVSDGDVVVGGGPILTASTSRLSVAVVVEVGDADEFAIDQGVTIELADGSLVDGTVSAIGPVEQAADPQATPTVDVAIAVVASAEQSIIEGPVTVLSVGDLIEAAVVVPTRSLVTLVEGGFAVEKVLDDGSTILVGIELGAFDDGAVEVTDGDLAPGDPVVVPR